MKQSKKKKVINIKKHRHSFTVTAVTVFVILAVSTAAATVKAMADVSGKDENSLTIRHITQLENGETQVLETETIENLTDIYYYNVGTSPVGARLLRSGYKVADEKNRLLEADTVSNGGKIDLLYTAPLKDVNVTYYMLEDGVKKEMGTVTDSVRAGSEYTPETPAYDDGKRLRIAETEGGRKISASGENDFSVVYEAYEANEANEGARANADDTDRDIFGESGKTVYLKSALEARNRPPRYKTHVREENLTFASGYPDGTFKPEKSITKEELQNMMLRAFAIRLPSINEPGGELVTFREFASYADIVCDTFPEYGEARIPGGILKGYRGDAFLNGDIYMNRGEAVVLINNLLNSKSGGYGQRTTRSAARENNLNARKTAPYSDVPASHWAFDDIVTATYGVN